MTTKNVRAGEGITEPTDIPTAPTAGGERGVVDSVLRRDKVVTDYETRLAVIGPEGAVDFHFTNAPVGYGIGRVGGIEEHRRVPAEYQDAEPDHADCRLLGGKCWHDGSSLYASEVLIPLYERVGEDAMWGYLEVEYRERFQKAEGL